jgi:hypothetical protein
MQIVERLAGYPQLSQQLPRGQSTRHAVLDRAGVHRGTGVPAAAVAMKDDACLRLALKP